MARERRVARHLAIAPEIDPGSEVAGTVGEYMESWLWGKQSLRPSTHAAYEIHIRRYLVPYLGNLSIEALRPLHVQRMYRELAMRHDEHGRGLSVATLRRIHATLMSAMNTAVRRGLIERNPAATVELPRVDRGPMRAWTAEELVRFLTLTEREPLH